MFVNSQTQTIIDFIRQKHIVFYQQGDGTAPSVIQVARKIGEKVPMACVMLNILVSERVTSSEGVNFKSTERKPVAYTFKAAQGYTFTGDLPGMSFPVDALQDVSNIKRVVDAHLDSLEKSQGPGRRYEIKPL